MKSTRNALFQMCLGSDEEQILQKYEDAGVSMQDICMVKENRRYGKERE